MQTRNHANERRERTAADSKEKICQEDNGKRIPGACTAATKSKKNSPSAEATVEGPAHDACAREEAHVADGRKNTQDSKNKVLQERETKPHTEETTKTTTTKAEPKRKTETKKKKKKRRPHTPNEPSHTKKGTRKKARDTGGKKDTTPHRAAQTSSPTTVVRRTVDHTNQLVRISLLTTTAPPADKERFSSMIESG